MIDRAWFIHFNFIFLLLIFAKNFCSLSFLLEFNPSFCDDFRQPVKLTNCWNKLCIQFFDWHSSPMAIEADCKNKIEKMWKKNENSYCGITTEPRLSREESRFTRDIKTREQMTRWCIQSPSSSTIITDGETLPGAGRRRRPRGSCSGGFWTASRCFWPVWRRWGSRWRLGPLCASTPGWWREGSRTLSCGWSGSRSTGRSERLLDGSHTKGFELLAAGCWSGDQPVWFAPRRVLWRRIRTGRWLPRGRRR